MATLNVDGFFADAAHWDIHRPDCGTLMGTVGGAAATNGPDTTRAIVNTAARLLVVLAFLAVSGIVRRLPWKVNRQVRNVEKERLIAMLFDEIDTVFR